MSEQNKHGVAEQQTHHDEHDHIVSPMVYLAIVLALFVGTALTVWRRTSTWVSGIR